MSPAYWILFSQMKILLPGSDIDYLSPLGKSDHSVLRFSCNFSSSDKCLGEQLNYAKGDYVGLYKHMDIDWELCLAQRNNIEDMWTAFK